MVATKGQMIAGSAAVALGVYGVYKATRKKKKRRRPANGCAPYQWNPAPVGASINTIIDEGGDNRDEIAREVATEHFGTYPGGGVVTFPPPAQAAAGVGCIWERTLALVDAIISERGFEEKPWEIIEGWSSPDANPQHGTLFRQSQGTLLAGAKGITGKALESAGVPNTGTNRVQYLRLIECSPWNDAIYNVNLSETAFSQRFREGPLRGISQNPQHEDNRGRMMQGLPPRRAAREDSMTQHDGGGRHAFMWLPLIEQGAPVVVAADFEDGRSGINPPADILAFGLEDVTPRVYGCPEYEASAQELPL